MKSIEASHFTLGRILISLLVTGAMILASITTAWMTVSKEHEDITSISQFQMKQFSELIEQYVQEHGHLPQSLDELGTHFGQSASLKDFWGRPFFYEVQGEKYILKSLGFDGQLGGTIFNRDIEYQKSRDVPPVLTIQEFLLSQESALLWGYSLAAGILAGGFTCWSLSRQEYSEFFNSRSLSFLIAWGIYVVLISFVMAALEYIPNGH